MKNDMGKRVFIVVLILCFGLLFFVCGGKETVQEMYDYNRRMENDSVFIRRQDGGILLIGGEGKLTATDYKRLLTDNKIKTKEIVNEVFDSGLTEIGYSVVNGYKHLKTVKLGEDVRVIHNGAVKNCNSLEYIFIPKGVTSIGRDCMYNCNDVYVVTDGMGEGWTDLANVPAGHLLTDVHSADDLIQRLAEARKAVIAADALIGDDPEAAENPALLRPERQKSTPAFGLKAGSHTLKLVGSGLDRLNEGDIDIIVNGVSFDDHVINIEQDAVCCELTLEDAVEAVEIIVANHSQDAVEIREIDVYDFDHEIPAAVAAWWQ